MLTTQDLDFLKKAARNKEEISATFPDSRDPIHVRVLENSENPERTSFFVIYRLPNSIVEKLATPHNGTTLDRDGLHFSTHLRYGGLTRVYHEGSEQYLRLDKILTSF